MAIPFVDLKAQYISIQNEVDKAIAEVIDNTSFVGGNYLKEFEASFAKYLGMEHCIGCGNGTDAIEIALVGFGITKGDEVIVPASSWISTSEAVGNVGATPVFVDVLPMYYTIDPAKIEEKITSNTKAIIPVHLFGLPAEMDMIMSIAEKHNLYVVEDCAQAHGALYKDKKVGTFGHMATFSFYPSKNLGAYGDGGCIVTNSNDLNELLRKVINHGQSIKHNHDFEGRNSRLDSLQAAILNVKLKHLDSWNEGRRQNALRYERKLEGANLQLPIAPIYANHVYHLYVVQTSEREKLMSYLKENGVSTAIHYPEALPFLKAYKHMDHKEEDFPVAFEQMHKVLSLPMYPELSEDMVNEVSNAIHSFNNNQ